MPQRRPQPAAAGAAGAGAAAAPADPVLASLLSDPAKLTAPVPTAADKAELLPAFLRVRGLVRQHIDSFDYLVDHDIRAIVAANERVTCDTDPNFYLR
jgi:DNA-directed RNA polymerase III subunit RPC2